MSPTPPAAPRRPHPLTAHGDERIDDWYWLRSDDRSDPEVLALLEAENAFVAEALAHTDDAAGRAVRGDEGPHQGDRPVGAVPQGRALVLQPHRGGPAVPDPVPHGDRAADRRSPEGAPMPGEEVLLDLNVLAGDSDYFALGAYDLAPEPGPAPLLHRPRRLRAVHDARPRPAHRRRPRRRDPRHHLRHRRGPATPRSSTCATTTPCGRTRCGATSVGTPTDDDVLVFEEPDERFFVSVGLSLTEAVGAHHHRARRSPPRST